MATPSPCSIHCHEVLSIPLLLETILLNLDAHTLLVSAQRVNKTFHAFIQETATLQAALGFRRQPGQLSVCNGLIPWWEQTCLAGTTLGCLCLLPAANDPTFWVHFRLDASQRSRFADLSGSWRRMLLPHPEWQQKVEVTYIVLGNGPEAYNRFGPKATVQTDVGSTLGDMFDLILEQAMEDAEKIAFFEAHCPRSEAP